MKTKRPDQKSNKPAESCAEKNHDETVMLSVAAEKRRSADIRDKLCFELAVFRSLFEKLAGVSQGDSAWTWDHENKSFLLQAPNHVIDQYCSILTSELGKALRLHVKRVKIIVDLRPWQSDHDRTSLRIGLEASDIPAELRGYTGLESLANLHFVSHPDDSCDLQEALAKFKQICAKIDELFEKKCEWMWETHWRAEGLSFAVIRKEPWADKSAIVEREIELFNSLPVAQQTNLRIDLSTTNRGNSMNVRIALEGWPNNPRQQPPILPVFDAHFPSSITK